MTLLLVGVFAFLAVWRMRGPAGRPAARWLIALALLPLATLWLARNDIARYRFTLLGLRYDAAALDSPLRVGGDYWATDAYVAGAGDADALRLAVSRDSAAPAVIATAGEDAGATVLVMRPSGTPAVLGGLRVRAGDTIVIGEGPTAVRVAVVRAGGLLPRPASVADAETGVLAALPLPSHGLLGRLWPARPSVLQRTYPLADVLHVLRPAAELPALSSFFYYDDGALAFADLDSEVALAGGRTAPADTVWSAGRGARLLVAGLPHRDSPDPDLTSPERYGVRPLGAFTPELRGRWLDLAFAAPEVRALDRASLARLDLAETGRRRGVEDVYAVRLTPARNVPAREAVAFDAPPQRFAGGSQAVFRLPRDAGDRTFHVLTPAGLARWESGRPFVLGEADRAILMRVDGQATGAGFWLVLVALLALGAAAPLLPGLRTAEAALAVGAFALAALRLPIGLTAHLGPPFAQEAHQLGLWLLPALPWLVVAAADLARALRAEPVDRATALRRLAHVGFALALGALALVLFPASPAKTIVLAGLPVTLVAALLLADRARGRLRGTASSALARLRRLRWPGLALGATLLVLRFALAAAGWREALALGGTRIAVSVLHTPLAVLAVALTAAVHARRIAAAGPARGRAMAGAALDLWLLLATAFLAVGALISDFGIVLVAMPGALLYIALLGWRWAPPRRHGPLPAAALALPLALFVVLQALPGLTRPLWEDAVQESDARMAEWSRNELLLLERGDPDALRLIGQRRSEALAVTSETLRSYTRRNVLGRGVLNGRVTDEIRETAVREHTVGALLASQWGLAGVSGLVLVLAALALPFAAAPTGARAGGRGRGPTGPRLHITGALLFIALLWALPSPFDAAALALATAPVVLLTLAVAVGRARADRFGAIADEGTDTEPVTAIAHVALLTIVAAGAYMVLANYGYVFFTGKNVYGLGLDSVGDALETMALLGLAAGALAARPRAEEATR